MHILLIITGSIAAYKALDTLRLLKSAGHDVTCVMTKGAEAFITPLSVAALSGKQVYTELFSLKDEVEMGHIRLSREADIILVAPASANMLANMAHGIADDLATTILLATDKPVIVAPAMNTRMWEHPANQRNVAQLKTDGTSFIGPMQGDLACGETGFGRMAEPHIISAYIASLEEKPLTGKHALVTAGPTYEAIDPVRFIGNRSSGKQGYAIAESLARAGATVTLISGPTALPCPKNVTLVHAESADAMLAACKQALPADIAICAAAVSDWQVATIAPNKLKKNGIPPTLPLTETPDILATLAGLSTHRPTLVIGFAAESEHLVEHAAAKLQKKRCDWLLANDISQPESTFGSDTNRIVFITQEKAEEWKVMSKTQVAEQLVDRIIRYYE